MSTSELAYVARSLGGTNGADLMAAETLRSLLAMPFSVAVVTADERARDLASAIGAGERCRLISPPHDITFPTALDRRFPRRVASWAKWSIADIAAGRRIAGLRPRLTIVNAFHSHRSWCVDDLADGGTTALIVQESPRHFGSSVEARPLEWALSQMARYSHLIFVSARCRDEWLAHPILKDKPSFYIPNCCREEEAEAVLARSRADLRRELGFPDDRFIVACVSTLQPRKGQDILVDVLPDLRAAVPDVMVVSVGNVVRSHEWAARLGDRVRQMGAAEYLRFLGARSDALEIIYAADALVLPSRAEALPVVVLEAMALGTPVVASAVDGVPELIEHGVSGMLFDLAQPEELVNALAVLSSDARKRGALAASARLRYWNHFSRQRLEERYEDAVARMLSLHDIYQANLT